MEWYKREADKILSKITDKDEVINLGAGFGPSGLPHIGTFSEIFRTSLVRDCLVSRGKEVRIFLISDDLDPLKKIPSNPGWVESLEGFKGMPLCKCPDPSGEYGSFSEMIEDKFYSLLDHYNIQCDITKSSEAYYSGKYNKIILELAKKYSSINDICRASVGPLRRRTYSIFMPISPFSGRVIEHIKIDNIDLEIGELTYHIPGEEIVNLPDEDYSIELRNYYKDEPVDESITVSIFDGNCKLQWKADWAMRLIFRAIKFEMHGDDLTPSAEVAKAIISHMGMSSPIFYRYGLFLDDFNKKISKSKGNGFSMDNARKLLTANSFKGYLGRRPDKPLKFSMRKSPEINDNYGRVRKNEIGFRKSHRIIESFHPVSRLSARRIIDIYASKSKRSVNQSAVDCAYNLFSEEDSFRGHCNFTLQEKMFLENVLSEATYSAPQSEHEFHLIVDNSRSALPNPIDKHDAWRVINKSLFGGNSGPRVSSWAMINGMDKLIFRVKRSIEGTTNLEVESKVMRSRNISFGKSGHKHSADDHKGDNGTPYVLSDIDFNKIYDLCRELSVSLDVRKDKIVSSLSSYQCTNVTEDEIERSKDLLDNITENRQYFVKYVRGVTSFLPLNQPLYASICFGFIPSLMARDTSIRPPTAMHAHYNKLMRSIDLPSFSESLRVSYSEKEEF
ncbi:hypothetical protein GCM10007160_43660 [Litchfieldella qijiaojingensis]|uniref:Lysine--tRNA ligase n=1 Tax=Litchfieldella qijiaojingensis TaxID=980347 RepID=A0ABQ2ZGM4_9GAMM|nr:hypothetical protein [Halomonas qijiaojingensis]GGY12289.1 hypothetical protein GCM10007160_43660 [Halomonas qijiaojingensis]